MRFKFVCKNCNTTSKIEPISNVVTCADCGYETILGSQWLRDKHAPNLIINYIAEDPGYPMITRIVETGEKTTYRSGQTEYFRLKPGTHVVVTKIACRNVNHTLNIRPNEVKVIYASSYAGEGHYYIE